MKMICLRLAEVAGRFCKLPESCFPIWATGPLSAREHYFIAMPSPRCQARGRGLRLGRSLEQRQRHADECAQNADQPKALHNLRLAPAA